MLQVYMAGPISGLNYDGATSWRDYAKQRLEAGGQIRALSPLRHQENLKTIERFSDAGDETERLNDVMSSPRGLTTRDRRDTTVSDLLFVNLLGATKVSIGTVMEIAWADMLRKPIVIAMEKSGNPHEHAMINESIGFRVDSLDEAIRVSRAILEG